MITRLLRKTLLAFVVTGMGLVCMAAAPAGAVGAVAGAVTGEIHLSPGIPTGNACAAQAFTFFPITLAGAAVSTNLTVPGTGVAVRPIITDVVTGGTSSYPLPLPPPVGCVGASENELAAAGTINPFGFRATTEVVGNVSNGNCAGGSYLRIGVVVLVDLTSCAMTVSGPVPLGSGTSTFGGTDIRVAALFLPDVFRGSNGFTTPIQDAMFDGVFGGVTPT